jgi:DNA-binding CsgD family transcriptional regulator
MHVPLETLRRATRLLDALSDTDHPDDLAELALPGLAGLVGCDILTYNEIGPGPGQVLHRDYPSGSLDSVSEAAFAARVDEHPLIMHYRATGDGRPVKISDFLSRQEFHNLGLYSEFFRDIPVEYQMAFSLPAADGQVVGIALNRARRDFTETDRAVLTALAEPLDRAMRRARSRHQAGAALVTAAAAGSAALADLTDRELQVLEFAAQGRTNQAIARTIGVSPRTIAKHLEHIYRKLGVTSRAAAVYAAAAAAGPAQATLAAAGDPAIRTA